MRDLIRSLIRWALDVVRGYQRAADGRDRALELLQRGPDAPTSGAVVYLVEVLDSSRLVRGPLGVGARLALTEGDLEQIRVMAQDAFAEACAVPLGAGGEA